MTIYRTLHTMFLLLFTASLCMGQQAEKTLVKSFNLQGNQIVLLDLDGPVELKTWNNDIMRIQMEVTLRNGSEAMLKSLVQVGRYNLRFTIVEEGYTVFAPGLEKEVSVRGKSLEESISFVVYAPEGVRVKLAGEASTSTGSVQLPSSL